MNDPEYAKQIADLDVPFQEQTFYWSPVVDRLTKLIDLQKQVISAVIASGGAKPPTFQPEQRPVTAVSTIHETRRVADLQSLRDFWDSLPELEPK